MEEIPEIIETVTQTNIIPYLETIIVLMFFQLGAIVTHLFTSAIRRKTDA